MYNTEDYAHVIVMALRLTTDASRETDEMFVRCMLEKFAMEVRCEATNDRRMS